MPQRTVQLLVGFSRPSRLLAHVRSGAVWREGDPERALRALPGIFTGSSELIRGEILSQLGRDREAIEAFRAFRRRMGSNIWDSWFDVFHFPRSLYLEAAALERLGERGEASRTIGRLFAISDRPDPELPYLREAKALRSRLAGAPAR